MYVLRSECLPSASALFSKPSSWTCVQNPSFAVCHQLWLNEAMWQQQIWALTSIHDASSFGRPRKHCCKWCFVFLTSPPKSCAKFASFKEAVANLERWGGHKPCYTVPHNHDVGGQRELVVLVTTSRIVSSEKRPQSCISCFSLAHLLLSNYFEIWRPCVVAVGVWQ